MKNKSPLQSNHSIGKTLYCIRKQRNLSQEEMAVYFDNHREYISRIERGLVDPRLSSLVKIAKALDIRIIDLLCDCEADK